MSLRGLHTGMRHKQRDNRPEENTQTKVCHHNEAAIVRPPRLEDRIKEYRSLYYWSAMAHDGAAKRNANGRAFCKALSGAGPGRKNRSGSKQYFDMLRRFKKMHSTYKDCHARVCAAHDVTTVQRMDELLMLRCGDNGDAADDAKQSQRPFAKTDFKFNYGDPPRTLPRNVDGVYELRRCQQPPSPRLVYQYGRPLIHIDFAFGRVLVELYTAACPTAVWNLVSACSMNAHKSFSVRYVRPERSMKMHLLLAKEFVAVAGEMAFECDPAQLDHSQKGSVLSVAKNVFARASDKGYMAFALTFGALPEWNDTRIAVGRVVSGAEVLNTIGNSCKSTGRLPINVLECGWFA